MGVGGWLLAIGLWLLAFSRVVKSEKLKVGRELLIRNLELRMLNLCKGRTLSACPS